MSEVPTVFISWSKPKAKKVAVLLKDFVEKVIPGVNAFVSEHDISKGSRGMDAIAQNLENAFFGIVCLTRENSDSPWINFEAGALSKHVTIDRVSPLLLDLGITDLGPSPLAQFQATFTDKSDFKRLLKSIAEQSGLPHALSNLDIYMDSFWNDFDEKLRTAVKMGSVISKPNELSKTESQLNELARLLNAISFKINSPEKLLPANYLVNALNPTEAS